MDANIAIQAGLYLLALLALAKPTGLFIAQVMEGKVLLLNKTGGAVERLLYRGGGIDPSEEMDWKRYALALLLFNLIGIFGDLWSAAPAGLAAAESATLPSRQSRFILQYCGQFRHQYQLARI